MKKCLGIILLALAVPLALAAQTAKQSDAWVGTWKLNVAKSKFNPGPGPQSETVTIDADGKVSVDELHKSGQSENWSYTYSEGVEVPITGQENSSVTEKRSATTIEHTWKLGGANYTGRGVLSRSGKVMTYTLDGTNPQGQHEHDVMVYDKQPS